MRTLTPLAILLIALVLIARLDRNPPPADLVFINRVDLFTLDPQRMEYLQDLRMADALYEGLTRWNPLDFSVLPAAAESWTISDDGLVYTFRLRENARWSNGDPLTAHDFAWSWRRAMFPDTAASYSNLFFTVTGAEAFFHWRTEQLAAVSINPWRDDLDISPQRLRACLARLLNAVADPELFKAMRLSSDDRAGFIDHAAALNKAIGFAEALEAAIPPELANTDAGRTLLAHAAAGISEKLRESGHVNRVINALDRPALRPIEFRSMWRQAQEHIESAVGLEVLDDQTLRVTLRAPTPYFLDLTSFGVFSPAHRPSVEGWRLTPAEQSTIREQGWAALPQPPIEQRQHISIDATSGRLQQDHRWTKPPHLVSNGPYQLTQWRYQRDLRMERNEHYTGPQKGRSDSIACVVIADTNTAVLAFESGLGHWLTTVEADYQADMLAQRAAYESRHAEVIAQRIASGLDFDAAIASLPPPDRSRGERRDITTIPTFGTDFYSFNCRPNLADGRANPFADSRVRRAFVLAVNKNDIVTKITRLNEPIATALTPADSIPGYEVPAGLPHDPTAARAELRAAGWLDRNNDGIIENERGEHFPAVEILYSTNNARWRNTALALRDMWQRELGIRIELRGKDSKFYKDDLKQGNFMIARGGWYGDYGDPTTFLDIFRTGDGNNDRGYTNPRVDAMLDHAAKTRDPAERFQILHECERYLMQEEVPLLPICQFVQVYMYDPARIQNITRHPRLKQFLWNMQIVSEESR